MCCDHMRKSVAASVHENDFLGGRKTSTGLLANKSLLIRQCLWNVQESAGQKRDATKVEILV